MPATDEPTPSTLRCHDWMMICGTNHYARDRAAFTTYKPIQGPPVEVGGLKVIGVGRVELQVRRSPDDPQTTNTLVHENVLHEPNAICNGISMWNLNVAWNPFATDQVYDPVTREPVWYGERVCRLWRLVLAGEHWGVSNLREGGLYMLSVYASPEELDELALRLED